MKNTYIIAEVGVNHNGSEDLAYEIIDNAIDSGADAVKFQSFKAKKITTKKVSKANYQINNLQSKSLSQQDMLKKLELKNDEFIRIKKYCGKKRIKFISTAFDIESLNFLNKKLLLNEYKISSSEITNAPLLLEFGKINKNVILSTGLSSLSEIENALSVLAFGSCASKKELENINVELINKNYYTNKANKYIKNKVSILHCTSDYPAKKSEVNLAAMNTIKQSFGGVKVGYSDHTNGIEIAIGAVALGAEIIEKHFTLDRLMEGPDHKSSLEPKEFNCMVKAIRNVEKSIGNGRKIPSVSEIKNLNNIRKTIVAGRKIYKNDMLNLNNLKIKRAGLIRHSPMDIWKLIGKRSDRNYDVDDLIIS